VRQAVVNDTIRKCNVKTKTYQEKNYNASVNQPFEYKVGDLILYRNLKPSSGVSKAFTPKYVGPYEITKILSEQNVVVKDKSGKLSTLHYNNIKPFNRDVDEQVQLAEKRARGRPLKASREVEKTDVEVSNGEEMTVTFPNGENASQARKVMMKKKNKSKNKVEKKRKKKKIDETERSEERAKSRAHKSPYGLRAKVNMAIRDKFAEEKCASESESFLSLSCDPNDL
jgi:hypothetical protein